MGVAGICSTVLVDESVFLIHLVCQELSAANSCSPTCFLFLSFTFEGFDNFGDFGAPTASMPSSPGPSIACLPTFLEPSVLIHLAGMSVVTSFSTSLFLGLVFFDQADGFSVSANAKLLLWILPHFLLPSLFSMTSYEY